MVYMADNSPSCRRCDGPDPNTVVIRFADDRDDRRASLCDRCADRVDVAENAVSSVRHA